MTQLTKQEKLKRLNSMRDFQTLVLKAQAIRFVYPEQYMPVEVKNILNGLDTLIAQSPKSRQEGVVMDWAKQYLKAYTDRKPELAQALYEQKSYEKHGHYDYAAKRVREAFHYVCDLIERYPILRQKLVQAEFFDGLNMQEKQSSRTRG